MAGRGPYSARPTQLPRTDSGADQRGPAGAVEADLPDGVAQVAQGPDEPFALAEGEQGRVPVRKHRHIDAAGDVVAELLGQVRQLEGEGQPRVEVVGGLAEAPVEQDAVVDGERIEARGEAPPGRLLAFEAGQAAVTQAAGSAAQVGEIEGAALDEGGPDRIGGGGRACVAEVDQVFEGAFGGPEAGPEDLHRPDQVDLAEVGQGYVRHHFTSGVNSA